MAPEADDTYVYHRLCGCLGSDLYAVCAEVGERRWLANLLGDDVVTRVGRVGWGRRVGGKLGRSARAWWLSRWGRGRWWAAASEGASVREL